MKIKFKSETHRDKFTKLAPCNLWIAEAMGMGEWECRDTADDENDRYHAIAVIHENGDQLTGIFVDQDGGRQHDCAWIFHNERPYFDIF